MLALVLEEVDFFFSLLVVNRPPLAFPFLDHLNLDAEARCTVSQSVTMRQKSRVTLLSETELTMYEGGTS